MNLDGCSKKPSVTPFCALVGTASALFFVGVLILTLSGFGIPSAGFFIGVAIGLIGLVGLIALACVVVKIRRKLSEQPDSKYYVNPESVKSSFLKPLYNSICMGEEEKTTISRLKNILLAYVSRNLINEEAIYDLSRDPADRENHPLDSIGDSVTRKEQSLLRIELCFLLVKAAEKSSSLPFHLLKLTEKMEEADFPLESSVEILTELLKAAYFCPLAYEEVATKMYYKYCFKFSPLAKTFVLYLNDIKKDIFFNHAQQVKGPMHESAMLYLYTKTLKPSLGDPWGLSPSGCSNSLLKGVCPPVLNAFEESLASEYEKLLKPSFLIDAMRSKINNNGNADGSLYFNALVSLIKPEELEPSQSPQDFVQKSFYSENCELNSNGVIRLLLSLDWLRFSCPYRFFKKPL